MGQFLKSKIVREIGDDLADINLTDQSLQLSDKELGIGHKTWAYLTEEKDY